jgi:hypothetical protein
VDFTDLDYEWGDDLSVPFVALGNAPLVVVVAPERYEAFAGAINEERLRTDLDAAFEEVSELIRLPRRGIQRHEEQREQKGDSQEQKKGDEQNGDIQS